MSDLLKAGSDHYKHGKIQPIEFIRANDLGFAEGCVVKYVTRYRHSKTPRTDIEKAMHYLQFILEDLPPDESSEAERRLSSHVPPK